MKRFFALFLALCLMFCFTACNKAPAEDTTAPTETTAATTLATTAYVETSPSSGGTEYQAEFNVLSMPLVIEETYAEDGTLLFTYTYQNVFPVMSNADVAEAVSLDLLNKIDASVSLADSVKTAAENDFPLSSNWTPYYCSVYYNTMRLEGHVLSLFGSQISYQGGAHPSRQCVSATYDLLTGEELYFPDVLYTTESISQLIIDALAPQADSLYDDYETTIMNRFSGEYVYTEDWYFSENGLCIFFSPYDIAPYAAGTVVAEIPYESLDGILMPEYFPADRGSFSGSLDVTFFKEADLSQYTQFAEVVLDRSGDQYLLYTDGRVYDVRIEEGSYYGSTFVPGATVFAAESIAREGIMVQTVTSDVTKNLRVSYNNGSETVSFFLLQGGGAG